MAPLRTEGMGLNSVPHPVNRDTFASNVAYPPGTILLHGDEIEDEDPESFFETQLGFNVLHSSIEPIDNDSTKSHSLAQTSATYSTISGFSTFSGGSLIPFRRAGCTYPLRDLCEEVIEKHVWLQIARIVSTSCYCFYRNLILHRFLLFQLRRPEKKDIWMRIDRTAGLSLFRLIMKRGKTHIGDIVQFSAAKEALIKRARRENDQTFKRLPFLGDFCIFFRVIAEEMLEYKTWPETSWVFCSIVQEYLGISGDGHYAFGGPITRNTAPLIRSRILRMVTYVTPNTIMAKSYQGAGLDTPHYSQGVESVPHFCPGTSATQETSPISQHPPWFLELLLELSKVDGRNLTGRINQHKVLKGHGSFGKIYQGVYEGETVCVKVLKEIRTSASEGVITKFCRRMMREVKVWTALQHSNVVTFHGWAVECSTETDETCAKLVSTWCEGGNVTEYLKHTPNADRRRLVLDAAQGLQYLHAKNVIHGDVKPENIVVNGKGIAMLCDFGLSCILLDLSTYADGSSTAGTARYTAPEVLNGEVQYRDGKSDVWALGCTSGQILFDLKPYHELETYPAILRAIMAGHAPFEWNNPDDFLTNINRCLKQNPSERPTIEELVLHFNYD